MARVQSRAQPPHRPEESVQSPPCPTASVAGICLLSIYHRWALAIKWIAPRGDCASISTIKPDSGAASRALHRHPVSNGYPRASRCPFLSTVKPGDACWLTQRHMHSKKKHLVTFTSRLEAFWSSFGEISVQKKKNFGSWPALWEIGLCYTARPSSRVLWGLVET